MYVIIYHLEAYPALVLRYHTSVTWDQSETLTNYVPCNSSFSSQHISYQLHLPFRSHFSVFKISMELGLYLDW